MKMTMIGRTVRWMTLAFLVIGWSPLALSQGSWFTPEDAYEAIPQYDGAEVPPRPPAPPTPARDVPSRSVERSPVLQSIPRSARTASSFVRLLPDRYDLKQYLPPPGQQKFNDCVGWAVAYATYSSQLARSRRKAPSEHCDYFSPAFIYNQIVIGNNEGCYLYHSRKPNAIDLVRRMGCASQATMPYDSSSDGWRKSPSPQAIAEAKNFVAIKHQRARNLHDIKDAIVNHYPVVMSVYMDEKFKDKNDDSIYHWSHKKEHGHTICAVGYDDQKNALLIMNSWGKSWKNDGYCWVSYDNLRRFGRKRWCVEAHVIKVVDEKTPIIVDTSSGRFELKADKAVYENGSRLSPASWRVVNLAGTNNNLFALLDDGSLMMLQPENGSPVWINLTSSSFKFGLDGKKVSMLVSDPDRLLALAENGNVYRYVVKTADDRFWEQLQIPNNGQAVDLRRVGDQIRATSKRGQVYARSNNGWNLEPSVN